MKQIFYFFLYLNIYTTFFYVVNAQNLYLEFKTKDSTKQLVIDSIVENNVFKNYITLKEEAESIHLKLEDIGYLENELKTISKKNDSSYTATYVIGNNYQNIKIFYSEKLFTKKELRNVTDVIYDNYFIIPIKNLESSLTFLNSIKTKNGNSFARIKLENIIKENDILTANLILQNSNTRTIDSIAIKGYEKFPKSFIKYYAGIKTKNVFDKTEVTEKSKTLNSLNFVSTTKPPEILFKKDSTIVYLYLKKEKDNLFDGILGFSSDEESGKLIFNGYLNLELNNNLNYGEQFLLNYKADGKDQQNFKTRLTLPYLFKTPIGVSAELNIFKRDSTFTTTDQLYKIRYQFSPTSKISLGYKSYESSNLRNDNSTTIAIEDYKSKFLVTGYNYTKVQNLNLFPIKSRILINAEIGSKKTSNNTENQLRGSLLLQHIINLNFKNSIFLKSNSEFINSDSFLTNELFRFGGINSIRGFNENSIDASAYTVLNTEYRYQFNQSLYIHSIIDFAYFQNQIIDLKQNIYSFGIGFGLQTSPGIIKFSVANGNTDNQDFNFSNTKIHISISSKF